MSAEAKLRPFLRKREFEVLMQTHHARSLVTNGHFLPSPGKAVQNAAQALIDRGFLTLADRLYPPGWIVVVMTDDNIRAYNAALAEAKAKKAAT